MLRPRLSKLRTAGLATLFMLGSAHVVLGQLNQNCVVSVLNRSVRANADGSWALPNVPAGFGLVRARATCIENGVTRFGESALFSIPDNGSVNLPKIILGTTTPIPTALSLSPSTLVFNSVGQTMQLTVIATFPDGSTKNVTAAGAGTNYTTSNSAITTVSPNGLVTAVTNGVVLIQAINEGAPGFVRASIVLSSVDTDGDGIPDADEVSLGLDPRNPVDAEEDFDRDNLTNLREYQLGTNNRKRDTDGDGLSDGDEALVHHSDPLLADTDGDDIPDGVEVQTGTIPTDRNNYDLKKAAATVAVQPSPFLLITNVLFPADASQQLNFKVTLIDGKTTLDLTTDARTSYTSSNFQTCGFGLEKGRIFAGQSGACEITITNNTLIVKVPGTVRAFAPTPLSSLHIPGFANNVEVSGDYAYVAAGSAGLQIVDVKSRSAPAIKGSLALAGNANDVVVAGNFAYVAGGAAGLHIMNVTNPLAPSLVSSLNTGGDASDVVVRSGRAYVANGSNGLVIVDVSAPSAPVRLGSINLAGTAWGVDVDAGRQIAAVAMGFDGLAVVNVASPANPVLLNTLRTASDNVVDVVISGNFAFLADFSRSFTAVDLTNPSLPVQRASTPSDTGGNLMDVAVVGNIAAGADVNFANGVPFIDVTNPGSPLPRAILNFFAGGASGTDHNGTGIALDAAYVYLTAELPFAGTLNGITGDTRLYIGQYRGDDTTSPTVTITSPANTTSVTEGAKVDVTAQATDNLAVASVSVLLNGQVVQTLTNAPYQFSVIAPVGETTVTLTARATDFAGNTADSSAVTINILRDTQKPVVQITSPPAGVVPEASVVTEVVQATDDVRVTRVDFLVNDTVFATRTEPPYEAFVTIPAGATSVRLGARAVDPAGNAGVASEVLLTVSSDPPPVVRIVSPLPGNVSEGEIVQVSIEAIDNAAVISTEFNVTDNTGQIVFTDRTNRRQFPLTIGFGATTYTLIAKATDNLNQTSTSAPVVLTITPEPAPVVRFVSPVNGSSVIEGAAVPIFIDATDDVSVKSVNLDLAGTDTTPPYTFLITAPPAFVGLTLRANAVDNVGKTGEWAQSAVSVLPDLRTTLQGTVVDSVNTPVAGAQVTAILNGLSAEVFNFNTPLTTLPDLTNRTPDKTKIISTPMGYRGTSDPFGFGLNSVPSRAVRFAGKIKIPEAGSYAFSLGVEAGGRLIINGTTVVDLSNATGGFQSGTGSIVLTAGEVPVELQTYYGSQLAVQLLYRPPNGEMQAIPPTMLSPALPLYKTTSGSNGAFSIPDVPTALGEVAVAVTLMSPEGALSGQSNSKTPAMGSVTNIGPVVIAKSVRDVASPLSRLQIPGFANSVAVQGNFAYVAAGEMGLQIVDISDRTSPRIVGFWEINGNANDVKVDGIFAYVAVGNMGVFIVNVSDPFRPFTQFSFPTGGEAWDIVTTVQGFLLVANGAAGLAIVDTSTGTVVGTLSLPGISKGVDVEKLPGIGGRRIAVVARGTNGVAFVDVRDPSHPVLLGNLAGGDARDVVLGPQINGHTRFAFVADAVRGVATINLDDPSAPTLGPIDPNDGSFEAIALDGNSAAAAGTVNSNQMLLPIYDLGTGSFPLPRRTINFTGLFGTGTSERGTGIDLDSGYAYFTTAAGGGSVENGDSGSTFLYIAQYLANDPGTIPPSVLIDVAQLDERQTASIGVRATDDVAVATITLSMNGQVIGTRSPLSRFVNTSFNVFIPAGATSVTLTATATDLANNMASTTMTVPVRAYSPALSFFVHMPDPTSMTFDGLLIWAAVPSFSTLSRINTFGPSVASDLLLPTGSAPTYVAVDNTSACNPKCIWVSNKGNNTLVKLSATGIPLLTVNVTNIGNLVSDGVNIWVLSGTTGVFKIRASDGANLGTFPTGGLGSAYLAYDGANIWITNTQSNTVSKIRASDGVNLGVFPTGNSPRGMVFDGANIWVANRGDNSVSKIRAADGTNLGTFSIGASSQANPEALAYDGFYIWVANDSATWHVVTQLRASDGQHMADIDTGSNAKGVLWDGQHLWVMNPEGIRRY